MISLYLSGISSCKEILAIHVVVNEPIIDRLKNACDALIRGRFRSISFDIPAPRYILARSAKVSCAGQMYVEYSLTSEEFYVSVKATGYFNQGAFIGCDQDPVVFDGLWMLAIRRTDLESSIRMNEVLAESADLIQNDWISLNFANDRAASLESIAFDENKFLAAVGFDRAFRYQLTDRFMRTHIQFSDDCFLPVSGDPADIMKLQLMIDSLDSQESHCLDVGDVETMFMNGDDFKNARVQRIRCEESASVFLSDLKNIDPGSLMVMMFGKLADLRRVNKQVNAILDPTDLSLFVYVQADFQLGDSDDLLVVWCHR